MDRQLLDPTSRSTRLLLACGLAPLLFIAVVIFQDIARTDYDPVHHWGSELSLGGWGWIQIANFIVTGTALVGFAAGLRRVLRPGPGSVALPALTGLFGVQLVIAGAFVMDPDGGYPADAIVPATPTFHATVHNLNALPTFLAIGSLAAVGTWWYARQAGARAWMWYSLAVAIITPAAMVGAGILEDVPGSHFGLVQRIAMFTGWSWIGTLAVRLLSQTAPGAREQRQSRIAAVGSSEAISAPGVRAAEQD